MKIGVVGLWHLGEIYSACLAELGNDVVGIDENAKVVENLNKGKPPLPEPKLEKILEKNIKKERLRYSTDYKYLSDRDALWITIDTPVDKNDKADTSVIFTSIRKALPFLRDGILIIITSQLPAGSSLKLTKYINSHRKNFKFNYAYIPENLRLGEAVDSFMTPARIVIGTDDLKRKKELINIFKKLKTGEILTMNVASAEMVKHATNAFLATSLSFIYDISDICELVGADITEVTKALKADGRIGKDAYLDSGAGFSGGTLARDLQYLMKVAKLNKINIPVIKSVFVKNNLRRKIIYRKLENKLRKFKGKTFSFYGLTYKAGTSTLRRSLPLIVAKDILRFGGSVNLYDPYVEIESLTEEMQNNKFNYYTDPYKAVVGASSIICITPVEAMKKIDFKKLAKVMVKPKIFLDTRNYFVDESKLISKAGLCYIGVGR